MQGKKVLEVAKKMAQLLAENQIPYSEVKRVFYVATVFLSARSVGECSPKKRKRGKIMSEQQKQDSRNLATLLESLTKEDRLQVQGVIAGIKLARKISATGPVDNREVSA